jgi:hypothetical protein
MRVLDLAAPFATIAEGGLEMKRDLWMPSTIVVLLVVGALAGRSAMAGTLPQALRSNFFQFFNLTGSCAPVRVGHKVWLCFRPSGPAFRALCEVDVETTEAGDIVETRLGIDRAFIDGRNGIFARDLAKSYLGWAVPDPPRSIATLIANIANPAASGGTVLLHGPAPPPPPPDTSGGYAVYLGRGARIVLKEPNATFELANFAGALPPKNIFAPVWQAATGMPEKRWLRIDVEPRAP